ncbi:hypothetical protein FQZ97_909700 [compost metagenome]
MKIRALKFSAIWCPATTVAPSPPISRAITAKMLDSANTAMPMGPPMDSRRLISGHCGLSNRLNSRLDL